MKAWNLALFLSIIFFGQNSFGQNAIDNAKKLKLQNKKVTILKNKLSTNPAQLEIIAGQYEIRPLNTNNCLGGISKGLSGAITGNFGYGLGLVECGDYTFSKFAIIPRPNKSYTIRPQFSSGLSLNFEPYTNCANIARNVLIGPKSIDFSPCVSTPHSNKKSEIGLEDQQFTFTKVGENIYQINTFDNECFDVRGQNTGLNTEIIKWACNGQNNQKFELFYLEPLEEGHILNALREDGLF